MATDTSDLQDTSEEWLGEDEDPGEDAGQDMDVDLDLTEVHPTSEQPELVAAAHRKLLALGLDVNPTYHWIICVDCQERIQLQNTYGHCRNKHPARSKLTDTFPSRTEFERMLLTLKANQPLPPPSCPISQVPSLRVVDGVRCITNSCARVFSELRRLREHCRKEHPELTNRRTPYTRVKAHPTSLDRANRRYVEILAAHLPPAENLALSTILNKFTELKIGDPRTTFQRAKNARIRTPFVAKTNWDHPLVDVELAKVRPTVAPPDPKHEPHLARLKSLVREYYLLVGEGLRELQVSHLTLRYLRTADPKSVAGALFPLGRSPK
jgi:hypothetical protein